MPKINHHRSSRRVAPPTDSDFDHEIDLVDRDNEDGVSTTPPTAGPSLSQNDGATSSAAEPLATDAEGGPGGDGGGDEAAAGQPSVVVVGKCGWTAIHFYRSRGQPMLTCTRVHATGWD